MKFKNIVIAVIVIFISHSVFAAKVASVNIQLPVNVEWQQISDQSDDRQYLREWIPSDKTIDDTNWLIVQQKFSLENKISAKNFLKRIFSLAEEACSDVKYNGPEKIKTEKITTYWGRFMCARQNGKDYGTFTDIRTISDGKTMYVITSELRIPPTSVAGIMSFGKDVDMGVIQQFMTLQGQSSSFTRKNVSIEKI